MIFPLTNSCCGGCFLRSKFVIWFYSFSSQWNSVCSLLEQTFSSDISLILLLFASPHKSISTLLKHVVFPFLPFPDSSSPKSSKTNKNFFHLPRFKHKNGLKKLIKYQFLLLRGKRYFLWKTISDHLELIKSLEHDHIKFNGLTSILMCKRGL